MDNYIIVPVGKDKTKHIIDGKGFIHNGVALHIRRIEDIWAISLFNTGFLTSGSAKTIAEAVARYEINEGKLIEEWKYEAGSKHLNMLNEARYDMNTEQTIDLKYANGRLVKMSPVKAGGYI